MADFHELSKSGLDALLPFDGDGSSLALGARCHIQFISPFRRRSRQLEADLRSRLGLALPKPNRISVSGDSRLLWVGRDQYFLLSGSRQERVGEDLAACVDLSDGWTVFELSGGFSQRVLARLTPLDVRESVFKPGHTARAEFAHMLVSITRLDMRYEIMVSRSYSLWAAERIIEVMRSVGAQSEVVPPPRLERGTSRSTI